MASRSRRRHHVRGYSLLEILVVLSIVALISSVVAIAVLGHLEKARISSTRDNARTLRSAVATFKMDHAEECPDADGLVSRGVVDTASRTTDAWDRPFSIRCTESGEVVVASGGPDRKLGTEDDIRVPDRTQAKVD